MFGAGHLPELIIILLVVVLVFGAKRLPEVGAGIGKGITEFRKSTRELDATPTEPMSSSTLVEQSVAAPRTMGEATHT